MMGGGWGCGSVTSHLVAAQRRSLGSLKSKKKRRISMTGRYRYEPRLYYTTVTCPTDLPHSGSTPPHPTPSLPPQMTIDDLRKSRGLHSVSAYRHGLYIYRSRPAGVAQSRHAFVGGTVSTWARWRIPVNKGRKGISNADQALTVRREHADRIVGSPSW